jgi:hypothetical protein
MSPADFSAWVAHMKADRKWSARRCARELGCGVNQIGIWSERGAPPYIALACAALSYGLPPWRDPSGPPSSPRNLHR